MHLPNTKTIIFSYAMKKRRFNFEKVIWKKIALNSKPSKSHYSLNCPEENCHFTFIYVIEMSTTHPLILNKHSQILIMYFFLRCDTISEHLGMVFCDIGIWMNVTKNHKTDYLITKINPLYQNSLSLCSTTTTYACLLLLLPNWL